MEFKFKIMSFYIRILIICAISYLSCSNPNTQNINTQEVLKGKKQKQINFNIDLNLSDYPEKLIKNQDMENWEEFKNLHNLFNQFRNLDFRNVDIEILKLSKSLKKLLSKKLPKKFEKPQIRSRLKVVHMQLQKSHYFTKHFKNDSLIPSLKKLYKSYNAVISRMYDFEDEKNELGSEKNEY